MRISSSSLKNKKVPFDYKPVYQDISLVRAGHTSERDKYESGMNARHTISLYVRLNRLSPLSFETENPLLNGDQFESGFFEVYSKVPFTIPEYNGQFNIVRCDPPVSGGDRKSIIDFIAYNESSWFPIEIKDSLDIVGEHGPDFVGFRKHYQVLALYIPAKRDLHAAKSKVRLFGKERLPGIVIRRDHRVTSGIIQPFTQQCSVFIVQ
jgi:hypothetical protein